jgi:hypothetical protein
MSTIPARWMNSPGATIPGMRARALVVGWLALLAGGASAVLPAPSAAQAASQARTSLAPAPRAEAAPADVVWVVPRLPDGRPDLQGTWENNSATPLERPRELAGKPRLSDAELDQLKRRAASMFGPEADAVFGDGLYLALLDDSRPRQLGATGTYSANWLPDRYFEHRTSLIESPADGRLPAITPDAAQSRARRAGAQPRRPASVQDLSITDRCISYGVPDLFAAYMSLYRIVQTPDYVAIQMEKIHDVRIVPLDGRAQLSSVHRHYMGEARGRWEGDTLVVETTNFHPNGNYMGGLFRQPDENLRLTERFTRVSAGTMRYEFTVTDPTVWTAPWTAVIYWQQANGEIYEYACHEGNYSVSGMLSGARADDALESLAR